MRNHSKLLAAILLNSAALAAPSIGSSARLEERSSGHVSLINSTVGDLHQLLGGLELALRHGDRDSVLQILPSLVHGSTPANVEDAMSVIGAVAATKPPTVVDYYAQLVTNGIVSGTSPDLLTYVEGLLIGGFNDMNNHNPNPPTPVYPKRKPCDVPYSVPETHLRSAIHIPKSFTYGRKPPVILFPGTGTTGQSAFQGNLIPLLTDVDWADPVWVNVPGLLLDDAQMNAEYAAYALNYIASLTKHNVSVVAWSQGNIDVQWAFKYWPSTRQTTSDHIAVSADYKGTILANIVEVVGILNDPSVLQQSYYSNFIKKLRSHDGDSSYVPTTSIYSGLLDEIVEPQQGTNASAYIRNSRKAGALNVEVQQACAGGLAGTVYTHESLLASPLTFALIKDAITHKGPASLSRLDLPKVCSTLLAPGLGLDDLLQTENAILTAILAFVLYTPKLTQEPALMPYTNAPPKDKC